MPSRLSTSITWASLTEDTMSCIKTGKNDLNGPHSLIIRFCKVLQQWANNKQKRFHLNKVNAEQAWKVIKTPLSFPRSNLISHEMGDLERQQQHANKVHFIRRRPVLAGVLRFLWLLVAVMKCHDDICWCYSPPIRRQHISRGCWQSALAPAEIERERARRGRVTCSREEIGAGDLRPCGTA